MISQYKEYGYNITTDPQFQNEVYGNSAELIRQFDGLYQEVTQPKNKKIVAKLIALIAKYPQSPQLKNFLSVAYSIQGNDKKAFEINKKIIAEHPNYLFGKLNLASEYMTTGEVEKVPELLGEAMELKALHPDRDLFHLAEFTAFYKVVIRYCATIQNWELAENRLEVLKKIAPENPDTIDAEEFLEGKIIEKNMSRWKDAEEKRITVISAKGIPISRKKEMSIFHHPEINDLYKYGLDIPTEKLQHILSLPEETVVADLEKVLLDAEERYKYFEGIPYEDATHNFPIHAIHLLAELKSEKSLPIILRVLENHDDFIDFWFGDFFIETVGSPIYWLAMPNKYLLLKQFLLKPGIVCYNKSVVPEVLARVAIQQPERKAEVENIFKEILLHCNKASLEDNIIDSGFLGLAIGDAIDARLISLLPIIKELYEKGYVEEMINGFYEEVERLMKKPFERRNDRWEKSTNIFSAYESLLRQFKYTAYEDFDDNDDDDDDDDTYYIKQEPIIAPPKVGRNEPCPCGSGKKYKKCCGKE